MQQIKNNIISILAIIILATIIAIFYWYSPAKFSEKRTGAESIVKSGLPTLSSTSIGLGGEIFEKTSNPLQDKIPSIVPASNPLSDVYKNPFE